MVRIPHGGTVERDREGGPSIAAIVGDTHKFGFMFPGLQAKSANRLPENDATVEALKLLGEAMVDANEPSPVGSVGDPGDSDIPAAYTYLGQFIDHDITFDKTGAPVDALAVTDLRPRPDLEGLINTRSPTLELDSLYSDPAPRDPNNPALMLIGKVTPLNQTEPPLQRPPGKTDFNDVPRKPRSPNELIDREALIGDPRNDENLVVAQLHLAFLKAHNKLAISKNLDFAGARRAMRQRYQWMVLYDFLPRICNRHILNSLWETGSSWTVAEEEQLFMPVEFAVAGYRFGHTMIRTLYDYNINFSPTGLNQLFTFTALSGQLRDNETLPDNWIIQWERFVELNGSVPQMARAIDAQLTNFTFRLQNTFGEVDGEGVGGEVERIAPKLAVRNLLRGYFLRLPTGQAVAKAVGLPVLEGDALIAALPTDALKAAAEPFKSATPLWFYLLAEAGDPNGANGRHLGAVGSRIVADTFYTLIKYSEDSILEPGTELDFKSFTLADLIALASDDTV